MDAELHERALVDQQRDALARRQLLARVLRGDLLLAAAQADLRAAGLQVLDQRAQQRGRIPRRLGAAAGCRGAFRAVAHQRPFHCGSRFSKNARHALDDVLRGQRQR